MKVSGLGIGLDGLMKTAKKTVRIPGRLVEI
jgi:hypothetical protein